MCSTLPPLAALALLSVLAGDVLAEKVPPVTPDFAPRELPPLQRPEPSARNPDDIAERLHREGRHSQSATQIGEAIGDPHRLAIPPGQQPTDPTWDRKMPGSR